MGKIARALRKDFLKGKASKVVNLELLRKGRKEVNAIMKDVATHSPKDDETDPLAKLYVDTTNFLGGLLEATIMMLPHFEGMAKKMERLRDDYMPDYPPMSPLTKSYYNHWELYDMRFGKDKETIARIFLDIGDILEIDDWMASLEGSLQYTHGNF